MEPLPDGDHIVYDLESEHAHVPLQRDLLVHSLQTVPEIFLGWGHLLGREEPRWVLRVPDVLDTAVGNLVRTLCLEDPVYLALLGASWRREAARAHEAQRMVRQALGATGDWLPADALCPPLIEGLRRTGAFAAFNWLVPVQEMAGKLAMLLAPSLPPLETLIPTDLPLSLRVERAQILFYEWVRLCPAQRVARLRLWYALNWGCLVYEPFETAPGLRTQELGGHVEELLAQSPGSVRERHEALRVLRSSRRQTIGRQMSLLDSPRAAALNSHTLLWAGAAMRFLRLVVDQEEDRHILRSRGFALLEILMTRLELNPTETDLERLLGEAGRQ